MRLISIIAFAFTLILLPIHAAQAQQVDPVLTINGSTGDNTTVTPLTKFTPLNITMTGTPGAPFALLLSAAANTSQSSGFYLQNWIPPIGEINSPVHPVFDGIGTSYISAVLALPSVDFVPDTPAPIFRFDANGEFVLNGLVPPIAFLIDNNAATSAGAPFGPGFPIPLPLDVGISLFLQVVSLDLENFGIRVGNGMQVSFQAVNHPASVAYSQGLDNDVNTFSLGFRQTLTTFNDPDLGDSTIQPPFTAPEFAGSFVGNVDLWMLTLSGASELTDISTPPDGAQNPDTKYVDIHKYWSSIEFLTGEEVSRNTENFEFPRITLPGNRELFHWKNNSSVTLPTYGFGILFKDDNSFRNLVPASFGNFTYSTTRSPWEIEVAVTPDGNRAMVVLDQNTASFDRTYILNLEKNGVFSNGLPIMDVSTTQTTQFRRVWEEGITFLKDGVGGWYAFLTSTTSTSTAESIFPNRLWKVHMDGTDTMVQVMPGSQQIGHIDRIMTVNETNDVLCVMAGPSSNSEEVWSISNVTSFGSYTLTNMTSFAGNLDLKESYDVTDWRGSFSSISPDGSLFVFARKEGNTGVIPLVARTDGSQSGTVVDMVQDINQGGLFALEDYDFSQGLFLLDSGYVIFHCGHAIAGAQTDNMDLFVMDLSNGQVFNLTRTISGLGYSQGSQSSYTGPWDPFTAQDRAIVGYGGSWLSPDGRTRYFLSDRSFKTPLPDVVNVYAVDVAAPASGGGPSFNITNVTGTQFEPSFLSGFPSFGTEDIITDGSFIVGHDPDFLRLRRVGGVGVLRDFYYMIARVAEAPPGENTIEQLYLFDGNNPTPAFKLTSHGLSGNPVVEPGATINCVTPSKVESKVAYILSKSPSAVVNQELIMQDLDAYAVPKRVPDLGSGFTFDRLITFGSIHWLDSVPGGFVFMEGATLRPAGSPSTDGISVSTDVRNPIDATPYFFDVLESDTVYKIVADPNPGLMRGGIIWNVE